MDNSEWDARFRRPDGLYFWDRQDGESGTRWAAFCVYRDMPRPRSLTGAYNEARQKRVEGAPMAKRANGNWAEWSRLHGWDFRCQEYDTYLELMRRREREAKHLEDLASFRERQRRVAAATTEAALALLSKAGTRLRGIDPDAIAPGALPSFFRAAAMVAEAGAGSEAQALALDELMRLLDHVGSDGE